MYLSSATTSKRSQRTALSSLQASNSLAAHRIRLSSTCISTKRRTLRMTQFLETTTVTTAQATSMTLASALSRATRHISVRFKTKSLLLRMRSTTITGTTAQVATLVPSDSVVHLLSGISSTTQPLSSLIFKCRTSMTTPRGDSQATHRFQQNRR